RQHRQPALGRRRKQAVHILESEPAIVQRPLGALRHQVADGHAFGYLTDIGFCNADDGGAAAFQPLHHAPSARTNTGQGASPPPGRCTRKRTRWPILTSSGAISSTRLIRRKPSSQSISATLKGAPSAGCTTVVAYTVPSPLLTRHSSRSLPVK